MKNIITALLLIICGSVYASEVLEDADKAKIKPKNTLSENLLLEIFVAESNRTGMLKEGSHYQVSKNGNSWSGRVNFFGAKGSENIKKLSEKELLELNKQLNELWPNHYEGETVNSLRVKFIREGELYEYVYNVKELPMALSEIFNILELRKELLGKFRYKMSRYLFD